MSEENKKWQTRLFDPMRAATRAPDSAKREHERAYYTTLDKMVVDKAVDDAFPRHASKNTDDRIQRLVKGLEESVEIKRMLERGIDEDDNDEDSATVPMLDADGEREDALPQIRVAAPKEVDKKKRTILSSLRTQTRASSKFDFHFAPHTHKTQATMSSNKSKIKIVDPDADLDDKVADKEDNDEEISIDKMNNARECDTDEESALEEFSSSNEEDDEENEANADDRGDGLHTMLVNDDDEMAQDEDYGAGGGNGGDENDAAGGGDEDDDDDDEDNEDEHDDEDDARRLLQQQQKQQQQQPPAKKAKKQEGGAAHARKSTPKISKSSMSPGQLKQDENKREWNAMFRDEEKKTALAEAVSNYLYIAGMQALAGAHNFRKLVLKYEQEDVRVERLANSLSELEGYVVKTLKIARADNKPMNEIIDFVTGALAVDIGSPEKAAAAQCCDITKKKPVNGEKLICLRAEHPLRDPKAPPGATQFKQKVVHESLRALVDATWFFINMLPATEAMVKYRLAHMKGIKNHQTTIADALRKMQADDTKSALATTFLKKLRASQLAINASHTLLAAPPPAAVPSAMVEDD